MAISLISEPQVYQPAANAIEVVVDSTNVLQCEFVYIMDLYVNNTFSIRLKSFPNPTDGYGRFRIERVLQDYLSFNFNPSTSDFTPNPNGICVYYYELLEKFNPNADCSGQAVIGSIEYTSDDRYSWNGAIQYREFPRYQQGAYSATGLLSKFLTNVPQGIKLTTEEYFTLGFLQGDAEKTSYLKIKTYNSAGTLLNTYFHDNAYDTTPTTSQLYLTVPAGPANLNTIEFTSSPAPIQPIISGSVAYYTLTLVNTSLADLSEERRFDVAPRCTVYKHYKIWWLNRLGQFDSWTFDLKSLRNVDITRSLITQPLQADYAVGDRGMGVVSVSAGDTMQVNTAWLTESVALWLEELFTSPETYITEEVTYDKVPITQAVCVCPDNTFDITGVKYGSGTVDMFIDDSLVGAGGIPNSTNFSYTGGGSAFAALGAPDSGTGQIVSYNAGLGFYTTTLTATIDPGMIMSSSAVLVNEDAPPCTTIFNIPGFTLPIGTVFTYFVNDGSPIGLANTGTGTITGYGPAPDDHQTDVPCNNDLAIDISGYILYDYQVLEKLPIVITNTNYEEKLKVNVKQRQYTLEFKHAYKKKIQSL